MLKLHNYKKLTQQIFRGKNCDLKLQKHTFNNSILSCEMPRSILVQKRMYVITKYGSCISSWCANSQYSYFKMI